MTTTWYTRMAAVLALMLTPMAAWSQNAIQSVTCSRQAGREVIRIEMRETLSGVPAGFHVKAPPRIALDLPGVANATGRNNIQVDQGNVRSVAIAQSVDRTRLVVNLKEATNYRAEIQGKTLFVLLDPAPSCSEGATSPLRMSFPTLPSTKRTP